MEKNSLIRLTSDDVSLAGTGILSSRVKSVYPELTLDELKDIIAAKEYTLQD